MIFFQGRSDESRSIKPPRASYDTLSTGNIERSRSSADVLQRHHFKSSIVKSQDDLTAKHDDKLPIFVSKLSSITVNQGEQAEFFCTVSNAFV